MGQRNSISGCLIAFYFKVVDIMLERTLSLFSYRAKIFFGPEARKIKYTSMNMHVVLNTTTKQNISRRIYHGSSRSHISS